MGTWGMFHCHVWSPKCRVELDVVSSTHSVAAKNSLKLHRWYPRTTFRFPKGGLHLHSSQLAGGKMTGWRPRRNLRGERQTWALYQQKWGFTINKGHFFTLTLAGWWIWWFVRFVFSSVKMLRKRYWKAATMISNLLRRFLFFPGRAVFQRGAHLASSTFSCTVRYYIHWRSSSSVHEPIVFYMSWLIVRSEHLSESLIGVRCPHIQSQVLLQCSGCLVEQCRY